MNHAVNIRTDLKARGLEGGDLESMIDHLLVVEANSLAERYDGMSDLYKWDQARKVYGHDAARLACALAAIGKAAL